MKHSLSIVVADDDSCMTEFYQDALTQLGHQVAVAADGRRLVELCRTVLPDLVITDIEMPVLDGIEAMRQVCEAEPVPVVVVSGAGPQHLRESALRDCVIGYFQKPIHLADLQRAVTLATQSGVLEARFGDLHCAL